MRTKKKPTIKKGTKLVCQVCGLSVTVNNSCGCTDVHPIFCCGKEMKHKKTKK